MKEGLRGIVSNKKGLSEVVTTLLFVLLALGAVLLVWFVVKNLIGGGAASVNLQKACLDLGLEIKSCTVNALGTGVDVVYQRGNSNIPDDFKFTKVNLVFEMPTGETKVVPEAVLIPAVLESKVKALTIGVAPAPLAVAPSKVGISGVLQISGKDSSCTESVRVACAKLS